MTRLERLELSKRRPYAREKPGRPTFLPHGQLFDRFFGPLYSKRFRPIAKIGGATGSYRYGTQVLLVCRNLGSAGRCLSALSRVPSAAVRAPVRLRGRLHMP